MRIVFTSAIVSPTITRTDLETFVALWVITISVWALPTPSMYAVPFVDWLETLAIDESLLVKVNPEESGDVQLVRVAVNFLSLSPLTIVIKSSALM